MLQYFITRIESLKIYCRRCGCFYSEWKEVTVTVSGCKDNLFTR